MAAIGIALLVSLAAQRPAPGPQTSSPPKQAEPPPNSGYTSVRFAYGGNVAEIPAEFVDGLILLPVHVNQSQPCLFVLDSTAASTSIDPNRAAELGVPPGSVELELAGINVTLSDLPHVPKPDFAARFGRPYEGTLGRDFFESFVVAIDYARKTIRLYDPSSFQYVGKGKSLHISFSGDVPVVRAKVNTNGKTLEGDFGVDTALDASVLFPEHYANAHHMLSHVRTIPATDEIWDQVAQGAVLARMKVFQIGPFPVLQAIATFSQRPEAKTGGTQLAGEIGGGMLRRFTVVFDYSRMQIIFDTNSEWRTDELEDMSGITLAASGPGLRRFEVTQVRSGTPGAEAGLQKGDIIAGVDEDPAADLSLMQLRDLFRQFGHPYKLTVERNDQTLHLTLKLKRLLPNTES
ncbi:MAG TPA: PDZ domain-containing protein [Candidatus Acidoferrales bacterium]|nr:PDZ domain-containing protein [Candidatus Acidoferrales bacterium]